MAGTTRLRHPRAMLLVLGIALVGWAVVGQPGLAAAAGLAMLLVMLAHLQTGERRTTAHEQRMRTNKRYRKLRHARRQRPFSRRLRVAWTGQ